MKNVKLEEQLVGPAHWSKFGIVTVPGDPQAQELRPDIEQPAKEDVIQSWQMVAVLRVTTSVPIRLGFIAGNHAEFLIDPVMRLDGLIGVHVGPKETTFAVWPEDNSSETNLELVEVTTLDDARYPDLPVY